MPGSTLRLQLRAACVVVTATVSLLTQALAEPQGGPVASASDELAGHEDPAAGKGAACFH